MEASDAVEYKRRWQAVAEIKQKELQTASLAENWRRVNTIKRRARRLGIVREHDDGEMEIYLRWAKLRSEYASG